MLQNYGKGDKNTKKRALKGILISILSLFLVFTIVITAFVIDKFNKMGDKIDEKPQETVASEENQKDDIIFAEEPDSIEIDIGSSDFKEAIKKWATTDNDKKMSDKNVINVLLVGFDSREGSYSGNTDVMMVASLNKKTKEIKLVSFLRDTYCYIETEKGFYYTKLNAAYSLGGIECLKETIENNYKIRIDNYVLVNFESFKAIIDAMGGVTVRVEQYEAAYMNDVMGLNAPWGEAVTLNGIETLTFCQMRMLDADGDVSRTRRQRQVIQAIIDKVSTATIGELNKYIDVFLPYIKTGYKKIEIISLGVNALTGKWYSYTVTELQMPTENTRISGNADFWIWVVDYELAANILQTELYGKSNIDLKEDRKSILDIYRR
ncbi:MAG: LCP family protein [Clostridia bacterium]|nr:LCP family protein [Clostridia bacterium]